MVEWARVYVSNHTRRIFFRSEIVSSGRIAALAQSQGVLPGCQVATSYFLSPSRLMALRLVHDMKNDQRSKQALTKSPICGNELGSTEDRPS